MEGNHNLGTEVVEDNREGGQVDHLEGLEVAAAAEAAGLGHQEVGQGETCSRVIFISFLQ
jgi:hypothetical protein